MGVSAAFIIPLHMVEVVIRNGVVEVLEQIYGPQWHTNANFERSLPNPNRHYSPQRDLGKVVRNLRQNGILSGGKVVADLKFAFWRDMFTRRHDNRLWNGHLASAFPGLDTSKSVSTNRGACYASINAIREFRNRIAHHEPIFTRNLQSELNTIMTTLGWRCQTTENWVDQTQEVTTWLAQKPIP